MSYRDCFRKGKGRLKYAALDRGKYILQRLHYRQDRGTRDVT